jgi:hypothetical protein
MFVKNYSLHRNALFETAPGFGFHELKLTAHYNAKHLEGVKETLRGAAAALSERFYPGGGPGMDEASLQLLPHR